MSKLFEALDGETFETRTECEKYEKQLARKNFAANIITSLRSFCDEANDCTDCPFYRSYKVGCFFSQGKLPCNYDIFEFKLKKDLM